MSAVKRSFDVFKNFLTNNNCFNALNLLKENTAPLKKLLTTDLVNSFIASPEQTNLDLEKQNQNKPTNRKRSPNPRG